ncbi:hypothetical protein [Chryseobacterium nematophagum]|uniref:hypothetical protein n=1 Tax=Chryseobacterium nematophagum TaxID=2305228 RepID=UPI0011C38E10|nr:hypothetical protein [Chryseobacterium nematophagum]
MEKEIIDQFRNIKNIKDSSVVNWMKSQTVYSQSILQNITNRHYAIDKLSEIDEQSEYSVFYLQITDNDKYLL